MFVTRKRYNRDIQKLRDDIYSLRQMAIIKKYRGFGGYHPEEFSHSTIIRLILEYLELTLVKTPGTGPSVTLEKLEGVE